ncbi:MAG: hypothetical protein R2883_08755 [Caldisericia bacterium]
MKIEGKIICHHTKKQVFQFFLGGVSFFSLFIAGMIIGKFYLLAGSLVWSCHHFFVYVEALVLCRHCPHYAESGKTLKCHANWGLPKIPKYDPKPLEIWEKVVWIIYVLVFALWYVPFFIISGMWLMLVLTSIALIVGFTLLLTTRCNRCYQISCPLNRTPPEVRKIFFENFPTFGKSYKERLQ